jgi:hypothetical protein
MTFIITTTTPTISDSQTLSITTLPFAILRVFIIMLIVVVLSVVLLRVVEPLIQPPKILAWYACVCRQ